MDPFSDVTSDDEAVWLEDPKTLQDSEWSRLSSNFTNAGYREGITAGKESALQQGFDEGFAEVGAPLGREVGILRGMALALISFLTASPDQASQQDLIQELRDISSELSRIRLSDIAPRDLEAERHAREHDIEGNTNGDEMDLELTEELKEKKDMEKLEDLMMQLNPEPASTSSAKRPTMDDVRRLKERLAALSVRLQLEPRWS
ncbi:predicted protein [Postia placenta Mad-698-R]|uniref:Protein YAE1 n=1 Tax=Postia placenta MAD-698-R-SB12 TaxID=670580 RepID=A0A1X6MTV0_9APHY|nr:hypothetical protein POSPLADRAFT_1149895 [Postia placenta MAD-698-R-SB12]EED82301.1 predicted protein [Postia placenta Mad-698-R]OSX59787.1 hypothetical protein POSPLADRAFT_1149895 [Postia placenta MAD-698-R-SB12]